MSSRKGKVAGDRESNREEKRGKKQRGESFICFEKGEKTESPTEEKRGKKKRRNREERVLYALKVWTTTNLPK